MKVAIVHYWIVNWRGGEKVLEQILALFPDAHIYCHTADPDIIKKHLPNKQIKFTFINKLPFSARFYQKYMPLMPYALEQLDLTGYDLVISSESGPAKNVITAPDSTHICYCHSPMRYVWDMYHFYKCDASLLTKLAMGPIIHYLKIVDRLSADRVDVFLSNSKFIQKRIMKCYRRNAKVLYPPIATDEYEYTSKKEDYYLVLGQLTPYKKADVVVDAFIKNGKKLVVIGDGEQLQQLRSIATSNISIIGKQPFNKVKHHLARAKALIFPGVEDFGMVPVEAMASGTPVICYAKGGALETVVNNKTGVYIYEQSADAINDAIKRIENGEIKFDSEELRDHANLFSTDSFKQEFMSIVEEATTNTTFLKNTE